jgi:hypothetical protein
VSPEVEPEATEHATTTVDGVTSTTVRHGDDGQDEATEVEHESQDHQGEDGGDHHGGTTLAPQAGQQGTSGATDDRSGSSRGRH